MSEGASPWFTYVVRCADDSLYVGVTTDLDRRLHEHNHTVRGARYTRARRPVRLAASWPHDSRSAAQKDEYSFRKLRRVHKLARIHRAVGEGLDPSG